MHVDVQAGIFTLSVRVGAPQVFWTCIWLLEAAYAGAVLFGLTSPVSSPALPSENSTHNNAVCGADVQHRHSWTDRLG